MCLFVSSFLAYLYLRNARTCCNKTHHNYSLPSPDDSDKEFQGRGIGLNQNLNTDNYLL